MPCVVLQGDSLASMLSSIPSSIPSPGQYSAGPTGSTPTLPGQSPNPQLAVASPANAGRYTQQYLNADKKNSFLLIYEI